MESFEVNRTPYFDTKDTVDEVGISQRQLGHWEEQGLISPELGEGSNKYTVTDIRRLKALRHLIVELRLPIPFVNDLVEDGPIVAVEVAAKLIDASEMFSANPDELKNKVLDLDDNTISKRHVLASRHIHKAMAIADEAVVARHLYEVALLLFRIIKTNHPKSAGFLERSQEILRDLATISADARLEIVEPMDDDDDYFLYRSPVLESDSDGGVVDGSSFEAHRFLLRAKGLDKYRVAFEAALTEGKDVHKLRGRFWSREEIEKLERSRTKAQSKPAAVTSRDETNSTNAVVATASDHTM